MAVLVFDYDGTVHNAMKTYAPAFRNTCAWLAENGYIQPKNYADSDISRWLGYNSQDMWSAFQPDLNPEIRERARIMLGEDMARRTENGEGSLYDGAGETLEKLRNSGNTLVFLSNCRRHYMERHTRVFGLNKYFDYFYCCEDYNFTPKYEIFKTISTEVKSDNYIVIGDRFHDIEVAVKNQVRSIGCLYGYGSAEELSFADLLVKDISEIPCAVDKLGPRN